MKKIIFIITALVVFIPFVLANECIDSDRVGDSHYKKGYVTFDGNNYTDSCLSNYMLKEYKCEQDFLTESDLGCDYGCYDGACNFIWEGNLDCSSLEINKGTYVSDIFRVFNNTVKDRCININQMIDYYCDGETLTYQYQDCQYGCDNDSGHCYKEKQYPGCEGYNKIDSCGTLQENDCLRCGYPCQKGYYCAEVMDKCGKGSHGVCKEIEEGMTDEEKTDVFFDQLHIDTPRREEVVFDIRITNSNFDKRDYSIETFGLFKWADYSVTPASKTLEIQSNDVGYFNIKVTPNDKAVFGRNNFQVTINSRGETIERKDMWVYVKENIDDPDEVEIIAQQCDGCLFNYECYPIGYRNGVDYYCESKGKVSPTKEKGDLCNNDYECRTNDCENSKCVGGCDGCDFGGEHSCVPIGTRVQDLYCSSTFTNEIQKGKGNSCENNYECISNLCIDSACVEPGLFQKIIDWFKKLFGG